MYASYYIRLKLYCVLLEQFRSFWHLFSNITAGSFKITAPSPPPLTPFHPINAHLQFIQLVLWNNQSNCHQPLLSDYYFRLFVSFVCFDYVNHKYIHSIQFNPSLQSINIHSFFVRLNLSDIDVVVNKHSGIYIGIYIALHLKPNHQIY